MCNGNSRLSRAPYLIFWERRKERKEVIDFENF